MKMILLTASLLLFTVTRAQDSLPPSASDTIVAGTALTKIPYSLSVQANHEDTVPDRLHNMYGDLLNDDPAYNPRYAWWKPALRVMAADVLTWGVDRYVLHEGFSKIGPSTWKNNLRQGWEWDADRFGINFIGHPYSGNGYFNIARSNGYSYWQSLPYAIEGSVIWEYFGENTRPSYNDVINTPVTGMFLGEILYRLSSNILDDRTRGGERVMREILAGILDPTRALNRLTQGKTFRVTPREVYQKEPLNITLYAGIHKVNEANKFGSGTTNEIFNLQLDYGNPFEVRARKPFDVFRLRTELSYGVGRKLLDNVNGYGILFGKNIVRSSRGILLGGFQNYDYWDNKVFELGTIGFGVGLISRIPVQHRSNLYSTLHLALVPLGANSTQYGPDTSQYRDYNFGGGLEAKAEETFNINNWATVGFNAFYYWIHTYEGIPGNSVVGILKPRITIKLIKNLSFGIEQHIYQNNRFLNGVPTLHLTRTEQKFFLQLFLEDPKRRGKYH